MSVEFVFQKNPLVLLLVRNGKRNLLVSILAAIALVTVFHGSPCEGAPMIQDCFDIWGTCMADKKMEWFFEHEDQKEIGDNEEMLLHYECVGYTVVKRGSCIKELTDGVCNKADRDAAKEMGPAVVKNLENYCKKWGLKL